MSKNWMQTDDFKKEKHVPVISVEKKGQDLYHITITVGKEIPHPNTTAHHIKWCDLFFWAEGEKFPVEVGYCTFDHHGESVQGADTSKMYSEPHTVFAFKTQKSGTLMATAYCNIHGLWKSEMELKA
ncbi:MAG: superoxide reductase [Candidatus Thorarchaeota archaeon]|nr:superoxide reductase [Candidatus Thorarchaeota archaeon]